MLTQLNTKQQEAVIDESKRLLILAGAGSGKTKTLTQKIEYLVKQMGVSASSILAITFTKNAANEMTDRLILNNDLSGEYENKINLPDFSENERKLFKQKISWIDKITVATFHALCFQIMKRAGVKVFDNQFKILADPNYDQLTDDDQKETPSSLIQTSILQCASENKEFLHKLKWYLVSYLDKKTLKKTSGNIPHPEGLIYTSLNKTRVRSKSEVFIADWLYRHEIEFIYELSKGINGKNIYPDFYIPAANLYIEHTSEISKGVDFKTEKLRFRNETVSITHEEEMYDASGFSLHLDNILRNKLSAYVTGERLLSVKEVLDPYDLELQTFTKYFKTALDLIKVEGKNFKEVIAKGLKDTHNRVNEFYSLFETVLKKFNSICEAKSLLDFNDLIIKANELLEKNADVTADYRNKYDYILVDEFQDVNRLQVDLLKLLLKQETQLFCVGDDWQSIYGFRGSDVDYIVNFHKHFKESKVISLNLNYRSTKTIVEAGNEVMKNNQQKVSKELKAFNTDVSKINVYVSNLEKDDGVKYVIRRIDELFHSGLQKEDILILGRRTEMLKEYRYAIKRSQQNVTCRTIHSSKGLEARVVFLVGMREGSGGFPDFWLNDRIYQVIRPQDLSDMKEEERRLFYVAITRAKEELVLITEANSESSYIKEIPSHFLNRVSVEIHQKAKILSCPFCNKVLYSVVNFCPGCGQKIAVK